MEFPLFQGIGRASVISSSVCMIPWAAAVSVLFSIAAVVLLYRFVSRLVRPAHSFCRSFNFCVDAPLCSAFPAVHARCHDALPDSWEPYSSCMSGIPMTQLLSLAASGVLFMLALLVKIPTGTHYLPIAHIFYLKYGWEVP